jgi:ABC-type uncharacterized transport system substrate-binding protein
VPKAVRVAVLVDPADVSVAESTLRDVQEAACAMGLQIHRLNARTSREIDGAFAAIACERLDALFVASDAFFTSQRMQFATLAARERIPAAYGDRSVVRAGGLMNYGTDTADIHPEARRRMMCVLFLAVPIALITALTFSAMLDPRVPQRNLRKRAEEKGLSFSALG